LKCPQNQGRTLLSYLEKEHLRRPVNEAFKKPLYSLEYETRQNCENFLQNIHQAPEADNIDFFFMTQAYQTVKLWFSERDYNDNNKLLNCLLAKLPDDRSVKFIWYDISDECLGNEYAVDVFSRINIGKIPLTNAELVRALFLQRGHSQNGEVRLKQLQIASEWDAIEKQLQAPSFWHFINRFSKHTHYETRIEFIFDLMKGKKRGDEAFFTFHKFNADFTTGKTDVDQLWMEVKYYFLTFDEWYQDRELYHLIGFLVECGESVVELKDESERASSTKTKFRQYLHRKIHKQVNCQLSELSYGDAEVKKVLLLFNIQTLLATREADIRFPFDRYKRENWDIEHIRSQTDTVITGKERFAWMEDLIAYFEKSRFSKNTPEVSGFISSIKKLLTQPKLDDSAFTKLFEEVHQHFEQGNAPWADELGNLTLLDSGTNRSYKNAFFPVKRARIIDNDRQGVFVPICTKNVFLKYYSLTLSELMYWNESDAQDYLGAIEQTLKDYLPMQGGENE